VNMMNCNGYAARIDYSDEDGLFVGHIVDIKDVVGFHGNRSVSSESHLKRPSPITWKPVRNSEAHCRNLLG
jgi:predicted HicB family RNase H-like nuclease